MSYVFPVNVTILVTYFEECGYNNETTAHDYKITKTFTDYDEFMSSIENILDDETDMLISSCNNYAGVDYKLQMEFSPYSQGFLPKNDEPETYFTPEDPVDYDEILENMFDD